LWLDVLQGFMWLAIGIDSTVELRAWALNLLLAAEDMCVGVCVSGNVVLGCGAVIVAVRAGCAGGRGAHS